MGHPRMLAREAAVEDEGSGLLGEVAEIPGTKEEGNDADRSAEEDADGEGGGEALTVIWVGADWPREDEAGEDAGAGGEEEICQGQKDAVVERGAGVEESVDGGAVEDEDAEEEGGGFGEIENGASFLRGRIGCGATSLTGIL